MSDLKLFRINRNKAKELEGTAIALEKSLQALIEKNLEELLGIRFLVTEHSTGVNHGGRIDTLGLDENGSPVIIEYKRSINENVINQGLFYLDWLMDHKAALKVLVQDRLGADIAETIDWSGPRLLCIAGDFTRYDEHAVKQVDRNIELIRYKKFGDELLLLELVNSSSASTPARKKKRKSSAKSATKGRTTSKNDYTFDDIMAVVKGDLLDLYELVVEHLTTLGDDVQIKHLKYYQAFKRIKNFACLEVHPIKGCVTLYVKVDPDSIQLEKSFTRDVRKVGHYGTGDLEITLRTPEDLRRAQELILKSYEGN